MILHLFFQNFALCFHNPIFRKILLAKSAHPYLCAGQHNFEKNTYIGGNFYLQAYYKNNWVAERNEITSKIV